MGDKGTYFLIILFYILIMITFKETISKYYNLPR